MLVNDNEAGKIVSKKASAHSKATYASSGAKLWADACKKARAELGLTGSARNVAQESLRLLPLTEFKNALNSIFVQNLSWRLFVRVPVNQRDKRLSNMCPRLEKGSCSDKFWQSFDIWNYGTYVWNTPPHHDSWLRNGRKRGPIEHGCMLKGGQHGNTWEDKQVPMRFLRSLKTGADASVCTWCETRRCWVGNPSSPFFVPLSVGFLPAWRSLVYWKPPSWASSNRVRRKSMGWILFLEC